MQGLMMDYQLTLTPMLERARRLYPKKEIVTKAGPNLERSTYGELAERVGRLANALARLGVRRGDRVATFAWNNVRHHELYFAVPCMGAVLHPINLRLPGDQIVYIANHAEDQVLFVDPTLLPAVEKLAPHLKTVKAYVVMADQLPQTTLSPVYSYEELLRAEQPDYAWPQLGENDAAAMCYTSGTTGNPKGVVYSHRSTVLHAYGSALPDALHLSRATTRLLAVLPLFHVNALFYSLCGAAACGGALVLVPKFSASRFWQVAAETGATEFNFIAAISSILAQRPRSEFVPHRIAKAYGAPIPAEIDRVFRTELDNLSMENDRRVSVEEARKEGVDRLVLSKMIGQAALREHAAELKLGLSQEALALAAEVDRTYVSQIERGVANPSLLILHRLAAVMGLSLQIGFSGRRK